LPVTEQIHAQELSLPCHQAMTEEEVAAVIAAVNSFSL
jgi:dTDP-4-amino-4,6-dideoxygalactose transaminase